MSLDLAQDERLTALFATVRATVVSDGLSVLSERRTRWLTEGALHRAAEDYPSAEHLFRAAIDDRMDRFVAAMAIALQGGDLRQSLETMLFHCALLSLDKELVALASVVVTERDKFPGFARAFHEECIERLPIALSMWLDHQKQRGALRLEDPVGAAQMLVGMMTSELRFSELFQWQSAVSVQDCEQRAAQCAAFFLDGCRTDAGDPALLVDCLAD